VFFSSFLRFILILFLRVIVSAAKNESPVCVGCMSVGCRCQVTFNSRPFSKFPFFIRSDHFVVACFANNSAQDYGYQQQQQQYYAPQQQQQYMNFREVGFFFLVVFFMFFLLIPFLPSYASFLLLSTKTGPCSFC
jgi:hypothetical protein